jgi:hypothetical protein
VRTRFTGCGTQAVTPTGEQFAQHCEQLGIALVHGWRSVGWDCLRRRCSIHRRRSARFPPASRVTLIGGKGRLSSVDIGVCGCRPRRAQQQYAQVTEHALLDEVGIDRVVELSDVFHRDTIERLVKEHAMVGRNRGWCDGMAQCGAQPTRTDGQRFRIERRRAGEKAEAISQRVQSHGLADLGFHGEILDSQGLFQIAAFDQRQFLDARRCVGADVRGVCRLVEAGECILHGFEKARHDLRTRALDLAQRLETTLLVCRDLRFLGALEQQLLEIAEGGLEQRRPRARAQAEHAIERFLGTWRKIATAGKRRRRRHARSGFAARTGQYLAHPLPLPNASPRILCLGRCNGHLRRLQSISAKNARPAPPAGAQSSGSDV